MFTKVGAILLAAGASRRMGKTKQLLPVSGEPAVVRCVKTLMDSGIDDIVVVVGHDRWRIAAALSRFPVCLAVNEHPDSEMAESIRIGVSTLPGYVTGVMVTLCDHPLVTPQTCRMLISFHEMSPGRILLPVYNGSGGHPTLFPASMCEPVVREGIALNTLLKRYSNHIARIPVEDPGVKYDMDTEIDYHRLLNMADGRMAAVR